MTGHVREEDEEGVLKTHGSPLLYVFHLMFA